MCCIRVDCADEAAAGACVAACAAVRGAAAATATDNNRVHKRRLTIPKH
jgi:hypothetical protein